MKHFSIFILITLVLTAIFISSTYGELLEERRDHVLSRAQTWYVEEVLGPTSVQLTNYNTLATIEFHLYGILSTGEPDIDEAAETELLRIVNGKLVHAYVVEDNLYSDMMPAQSGYLYYADCWFNANSSLIERGLVLVDESLDHWLLGEFLDLQDYARENEIGCWGDYAVPQAPIHFADWVPTEIYELYVINIISPVSVLVMESGSGEVFEFRLLGVESTGNEDIDQQCMTEMKRLVYQSDVYAIFDDNVYETEDGTLMGHIVYGQGTFLLSGSLIARGLLAADYQTQHILLQEFINAEEVAYENRIGFWGLPADNNFEEIPPPLLND